MYRKLEFRHIFHSLVLICLLHLSSLKHVLYFSLKPDLTRFVYLLIVGIELLLRCHYKLHSCTNTTYNINIVQDNTKICQNKMAVIVQYSALLYLTLLIFEVAPQSEYGENYEQNLEYYDEPSDSEYYYGDYGDEETEAPELITTKAPPREWYCK